MTTYTFDSYELDTQSCLLRKGAETIALEPQVYCLLELLVMRASEMVSRDDIIDAVWDGRAISSSTIDNRVKAVRSVIGDNGKKQRLIKTYPNRGYKFIGEVQTGPECAEAALAEAGASEAPGGAEPQAPDQEQPAPAKTGRNQKIGIAAGALALLVAVGMFLLPNGLGFGDAGSNQVAASADDELSSAIRLAILPPTVIGQNERFPALVDVLQTDYEVALDAVSGLSIIQTSPLLKDQVGQINYNQLRADLGADYALVITASHFDSKTSIYAKVSNLEDGTVELSQRFEIDESEGANMSEALDEAARQLSFRIANQFGLSVDQYAPQITNLAVQQKIVQARELAASHRHSDLVEAIALLKAVTLEEPDYLPAHAALVQAYWDIASYATSTTDILFRDFSETYGDMKRIAPDAPDTLSAEAIIRYMELYGFLDPGGRKVTPEQPIELLDQVLEKEPKNRFASYLKASLVWLQSRDPAQAETLLGDALDLDPAQPELLGNLMHAKFCLGDVDGALNLAERNLRWNPGHATAVEMSSYIYMNTGRYKQASDALSTFFDEEKRTARHSVWIASLNTRIGAPELAFDYVSRDHEKAFLLAHMGQKKAAQLVLDDLKGHDWSSAIASSIVGRDDVLLSFVDGQWLATQMAPRENSTKTLNFCESYNELLAALVIEDEKPEVAKRLRQPWIDHYKVYQLDDLRTAFDLVSVMAIEMHRDNPEAALKVLDSANKRGIVFLNVLQEPLFRDLREHPGYAAREKRMRQSGQRILKSFSQAARTSS